MKSELILKTYFWLYNIIRNYGPLTLNKINGIPDRSLMAEDSFV